MSTSQNHCCYYYAAEWRVAILRLHYNARTGNMKEFAYKQRVTVNVVSICNKESLTARWVKWETVLKMSITMSLHHSWSTLIVDCATDEWLLQWRQLGPFRSRFIRISDVCFVNVFLQYFTRAVMNLVQIWRIWRPRMRWDKFWSFYK